MTGERKNSAAISLHLSPPYLLVLSFLCSPSRFNPSPRLLWCRCQLCRISQDAPVSSSLAPCVCADVCERCLWLLLSSTSLRCGSLKKIKCRSVSPSLPMLWQGRPGCSEAMEGWEGKRRMEGVRDEQRRGTVLLLTGGDVRHLCFPDCIWFLFKGIKVS